MFLILLILSLVLFPLLVGLLSLQFLSVFVNLFLGLQFSSGRSLRWILHLFRSTHFFIPFHLLFIHIFIAFLLFCLRFDFPFLV